jgi:alpha-1,6-mannosyltransferase
VLTLAVDSYFWTGFTRPLWPELAGIYFNVLQGNSSNWGARISYLLFILFNGSSACF